MIALCGFPGCGKTSVSKKISDITGLTYADSDEQIEKIAGDTIFNIFENKGDSYFRKLECSAIKEILKDKYDILSLGGGTVIDPINVEIIKLKYKIIYLDVSLDEIISRLRSSHFRPILANESKIEELYNKRASIYMRVSDEIIDGNGDISSTCKKIIKLIGHL
jgi:shikimate kinase